MDGLYQYLQMFFGHLWPLISAGSLLGLEEASSRYWPWASQYLSKVSSPHRTLVRIVAILTAVFYSGFLAWQDEHQALRNLASKQSPDEIQPLRSEISGLQKKLSKSASESESQRTKIESQSAELRSQEAEIKKLQPKPRRFLSANDKKRLNAAISKIKDRLANLQIGAQMNDDESYSYAKELLEFFRAANPSIKEYITILIPTTAFDSNGSKLNIAVKDVSHFPPDALALGNAMIEAGFDITGGNNPNLSENTFMIVVISQK